MDEEGSESAERCINDIIGGWGKDYGMFGAMIPTPNAVTELTICIYMLCINFLLWSWLKDKFHLLGKNYCKTFAYLISNFSSSFKYSVSKLFPKIMLKSRSDIYFNRAEYSQSVLVPDNYFLSVQHLPYLSYLVLDIFSSVLITFPEIISKNAECFSFETWRSYMAM